MCATRFIGYARFLNAVWQEPGAADVTGRLRTLYLHRDGKGRWTRFPSFYTLLVLTEIALAQARDELRYAQAVWESKSYPARIEQPYAGRSSSA